VCAKTYATWANIVKTIVQLVPRNQFTLMQEQAKAELEKIQAAKDKKEQKEQEKVEKAKAKEEKKREREEKKTQRGSPGRESKESCWKAEEGPRF
jgi:predicted phage gp36 major capsid-like protein